MSKYSSDSLAEQEKVIGGTYIEDDRVQQVESLDPYAGLSETERAAVVCSLQPNPLPLRLASY